MLYPPPSVEIAFEKNIYDEKNLTVNALTTYKPNEKPPKKQVKTAQKGAAFADGFPPANAPSPMR